MAVDFIAESGFSGLIESPKFKGGGTAIRPDEPMEADPQAALILAGHSARRPDHPRSAGNQDALAIGAVEGHRDLGEDGPGKSPFSCVTRNRFEE